MSSITISSPPNARTNGAGLRYNGAAGTSSAITNTVTMRSGHQGASPTLVAAAVSGGTSSMETPEEVAARRARQAESSRAYRERNADKVRAAQKAYRAANPRDREAEKARLRGYRAANPDEARAKDAAYYQRTGPERRAYQKARYAANKEEIRAKQRAYQEANAERFAERKRANRPHERARVHGLTHETVEALYALQGGRCAICSVEGEVGGTHGLRIDHDHTTGERRGLLCHLCNVALPAVERTGPTWADNAARYLASPPLRSLR